MTKFNKPTTGSHKTVNLAGGPAYILTLKQRVMTGVLTSFFGEPKFYGDNTNALMTDIIALIEQDPQFVVNVALYAREQLYLRSITHAITAELAHSVKGKPFVRALAARVCQRADDMTEILAYYLQKYGKPIPNSLKKGLGDAFKKFDEYALAKWDKDSKTIGMRDILCLCRPAPATPAQAALWKNVLEGTLQVPLTWETALSANGNNAKTWEDLIEKKAVGYMAALRNLRNMIQSGAKNIGKIYEYLTNAKAVANSKQLPFRFFSAYRELAELGTAGSQPLDTIETAMALSVANLERLPGTTFMTSDNSGSMHTGVSGKSKVRYIEIASLLMAIAHQFCDNAITSVFGETFATVNTSTKHGILANMEKFKNTDVGHSTNTWLAIEWLTKTKTKVDRIIVFSDCQAWNSYGWGSGSVQKAISAYRTEVNPNVWVHSVDLAGYGTSAFALTDKTNLIAGWSDKILKFIALAERGQDTLIKEIASYHLQQATVAEEEEVVS